MIELETLQMLVYQHVVQLTLIDHPPHEAFKIAHRVAALAFDEAFTQAGLDAARAAIDRAEVTVPAAPTDAQPRLDGKATPSRPTRKMAAP